MQQSVAQQLKTSVNWNRFFLMVNAVGDQLNDRTLRFLKSIVQDSAIARMSGGTIEYVDLVGQDHQMGEVRIETKCGTNVLTTGRGKAKRAGVTGSVKLNNTLGSSDGRTLPDTFDYLMIVDTDAVAIAKYQDILPYVSSNGDGLSVKLPYEVLEWVVEPGEFDRSLFEDQHQINIIDRLQIMINEVIDEFDAMGG